MTADAAAIRTVREELVPLTGSADDYDPLMKLVGDARVVLLGEASHGTHEFYHERARITKRLITEKGFTTVAVEADWPDAYRVNRFVRGTGGDGSANEALDDFKRFPLWMWRNVDVLTLVDWLREYNDALPEDDPRVGFYGLDLYSLFGSIESVLAYLDEADPEAAARARARYACFDHASEDSQAYGYAANIDTSRSCEDAAVSQLVELRRRAVDLASRDGRIPEDEFFFAEQNARVVKNAEEYYREMFRGRVSSWNLRDRHMADTLEDLVGYFDGKGVETKVVVWAHNSHNGDARATEMGRRGEWNVGQLARERFGGDAVLVGFTTHRGTVTAASDWGAPVERKRVRPALDGSYEKLLHEVGEPAFLLPLRGTEAGKGLEKERLERAIGVIYRPETERVSHYFSANLSRQFDAVIHFDATRAVEPLETTAGWEDGDAPETYPFTV